MKPTRSVVISMGLLEVTPNPPQALGPCPRLDQQRCRRSPRRRRAPAGRAALRQSFRRSRKSAADTFLAVILVKSGPAAAIDFLFRLSLRFIL
jgi:hypothetical protein